MEVVYLRGNLKKHWQANGELKEKWKMTKEECLIKLYCYGQSLSLSHGRPQSLEMSTLRMRDLDILCSKSHQSGVKIYWQWCHFNKSRCLWRQTWLQQPDDCRENVGCTTIVSSGNWDRDFGLLSTPLLNKNAISQRSSQMSY